LEEGEGRAGFVEAVEGDRLAGEQLSEGMHRSLDELNDLTVLEGPFVGQPAAVALADRDFRERAARWKPTTGTENRKRIGLWAKFVKAWDSLGWRAETPNVPLQAEAVAAPSAAASGRRRASSGSGDEAG
jgi:hypothetical protein